MSAKKKAPRGKLVSECCRAEIYRPAKPFESLICSSCVNMTRAVRVEPLRAREVKP